MEAGSIQPVPKISLDKYDRRILSCLMIEGKVPLSQIAKKIGISKHRVINRVKHLESRKIIIGYQAYINLQALGVNIAFIYIKTRGTQSHVEEYIARFNNIPLVASVKEILGDYNLLITFFYTSKEHRDILLNSILQLGITRDFFILHVEKINFTFFDVGKERLNGVKPLMDVKLSKANLDNKDLEILYALSRNYRQPLWEIGEKIKLTREAVNFRLQRLIKDGYIGKFQPSINIFALGYEAYILRLKLINRSNVPKIIYYLANTFNCNAIYELDSEWNIIAFLHFLSTEELRDFEDILIKNYQKDIYDYAFDLIKRQTKLEWFPKELISILKRK